MEFQHISIFCDLQLTTRRRFFKEQWQYAIRNLIPVKQHQLTKQHYLYLLSTNRFLWKLVWYSQNLNSFINFIYSNCIGTPKGSSCNLSLSLNMFSNNLYFSNLFHFRSAACKTNNFVHIGMKYNMSVRLCFLCLVKDVEDPSVFYVSCGVQRSPFISYIYPSFCNIIINQMEYDAVFHNKNTCDTRRDYTWIQNQDLVPLVGEYGEHLG